uniref:Cerebellin 18 n=1 Tax=Latimeria chalumnae TaxID=7897 RepID=H3BHC2_LATCH
LKNMCDQFNVYNERYRLSQCCVLSYLLHIKKSRQIAFSASLTQTGFYGPFSADLPVKYDNIILNKGNCYNPSMGMFTVSVKGIYAFMYTVYTNQPSSRPRVYHSVTLMKNLQAIVSVWEDSRQDYEDSATNAVILQLEKGDQVYIQLQAGRYFSNYHKQNTLSGLLLFSL